MIPRLRERDYIDGEGMHYALLSSSDSIAPHQHRHEFFEIFLLLEGRIDHLVNAQHVSLFAGAMCFIRPDDAHSMRVIEKPCQLINVAIARQTIEALWHYLGPGIHAEDILKAVSPPTTYLSAATTRALQSRLQALNNYAMDKPSEKHSALRILLFELVTQYFSAAEQAKAQPDMPRWLQLTCEAMHKPEHFVEGLPRMLALAAVSPEHLSRSVKKYLHQTPTAFINQLRLRYAANLLRHGDQDVVTIAHEVGFESLSYFYAKFKAEYHVTPKAFRAKHQPLGWQRSS